MYNFFMKIAIYGGSFNPIHKGHIKVAEEAIKELKLDKFIFVPAFKSPFKSKVKYAEASHRVNMIKEVLPEKSEVSEFEINRKGVSYTIDTLKYFKQKYPNDELFLIIGSDNVYKLNKWRNINEIVELAKIVVFRRQGDFSKLNIKRYNAKLLNNELYNYSSTDFRNGLLNNVDDKVRKYIGKNYLYVQDLMLSMLDNKRHKHSQAVGVMAAQLAKQVGVDIQKAWLIGCFHDITKSWSNERQRRYLDSKDVDHSKMGDFELHTVSGAIWVKDEYALDDKEVYSAIIKHTSLDKELSLMDKVIYVADKLCEGRKWEGIQKDRELVRKDFDKGFKNAVKRVYSFLMIKERPLTDEQKEIYKGWM